MGTGAACGAFRLDEGFKAALRRKLGRHADTLLKARTLDEAVNYFENAIKRQHNPYSQDCENEYEIPMAGVVDIPAIGLEAGYLRFSQCLPQCLLRRSLSRLDMRSRKFLILSFDKSDPSSRHKSLISRRGRIRTSRYCQFLSEVFLIANLVDFIFGWGTGI